MKTSPTAPLQRRRISLATGDDALAEDRLALALEEFAAAQDSDTPLSREALLQKYADVADELIGCLDSLDFIRQVAPQLGDAAIDSDDASPTSVRPLAALGDFRIVREIGRGGMGVVYEAEQLSLGRRVALKVLPFAAAFDSRQLQRFKNEAQAAAHLHHTNIVPVHAVGCERGMHFYAMQLIEGESLAQLI